MSKFSRVVKFKEGFHTIAHQGETYKEDRKDTGVFEAPHAVANHFKNAGFVEDFAEDMDAAVAKLDAAKRAAQNSQTIGVKK
jgi:hypothetical protein